MISVFSEHTSPRLSHVLDFFFKDKGEEYQIITDRQQWAGDLGQRINYSNIGIVADYQIKPSNLLFESEIRSDLELDEALKIDGVYDELAIVFYFLSRYEEYSIQNKDQHDRVRSSDLYAVKNGLHKTPLADKIVKDIWQKLHLNYQPILDRFQCVPSFDIDIAWAYKNRPAIRQLGAIVKGGDLANRTKVLLGKEKDPYDTYSYITEVSAKLERIICFVLLGDWSKYDKNINWKNEEYRSLIRGLNATGGMGIHPSYNSYLDLARVQEEKDRLMEIVGHDIIKSRQHFLRMKFPDTYRVLLETGIKNDYSMGFADEIGFRAGTSFPYYHFSLENNSPTDLKVFPFMYMDSALKDYLKLSISEAESEVKHLVDEVKNVGGNLMCVWHNSSINNMGEWKGWKDILDLTISESLKK